MTYIPGHIFPIIFVYEKSKEYIEDILEKIKCYKIEPHYYKIIKQRMVLNFLKKESVIMELGFKEEKNILIKNLLKKKIEENSKIINIITDLVDPADFCFVKNTTIDILKSIKFLKKRMYFFYKKQCYYYLKKLYKNIKNKIPISKLLGVKGFWNHDFLNKNVLDPRQESEVLVKIATEYLLKKIEDGSNNIRILELGIGSGCIILSVIHNINRLFPEIEISALGTDISSLAIKTAERNKKKLKIKNCQITHSNWWKESIILNNFLKNTVDLCISNPPYVGMEETGVFAPLDPPISIFTEDHGLLEYKNIIYNIPKSVATILFEVPDNLYKQVIVIAEENNFSETYRENDINNIIHGLILQKKL